MTPQQAVQDATVKLDAAAHEAASYAARQIVAHVLETDATGLVLRDAPLSDEERAQVDTLTEQVAGGTPLWRALGHREFHGLDLALNADTLEPRDDTEVLVEAALSHLPDRTRPWRFADLGTGTGAVALALLSELPNAQAVLTDISASALEIAAQNAEAHGFGHRIDARQGDWLAPLAGVFDAIVSNPPYIESHVVDELDKSVRAHDPRPALNGGPDGLDAYRAILANGAPYLAPNGVLCLEIGYNQRETVSTLGLQHGWTILSHHRDGGAHDRVIVLGR